MTIKRRQRSSSKKLTGPFTRAMLAAFRVPVKDQPAGIEDRTTLLEAMRSQDEELYDRYYQVIVNGVDPLTLTKDVDVNTIAQHEISNHIRTTFEDYTQEQGEWFKDVAKNHMRQLEVNNATVLETIGKDMEKAIEAEAKKFRTVKVQVGTKKAVDIGNIVPKVFDKIVQLAAQRKNILLVGPAGSGKTYMAGLIAKALDMEYSAQSCTEGMSESMLAGWLLPVGENGKFVYVPSEFVRIYENGGVFLLDEIDAADPNVLVFINQALANGEFFLPQRIDNPKVNKHPDAVIMAAANTYGNGADMQYVGRNKLDNATLDRFKIGTVTMDYDEDVERALISEEVLEWGWEIRHRITVHKIERVLSTRVMIDAMDMIQGQGWKLSDVKESYFSDWSKEELVLMRDGV